jgi:hypothetical protein
MKGPTRSSSYEREVPHAGYTAGVDSTDDCDLQFLTKIFKPNSEILSVKNGDVLPLQLGTKNTIEVLNLSGNICGNISSSDNAKMVSCMKRKVQFHATVLSKSALICNVKVERV